MFYIKLLFIVVAGSIAIWFAIYRLVADSGNMGQSFSHNTDYIARASEEASSDNSNLLLGNSSDDTSTSNDSTAIGPNSDEQASASGYESSDTTGSSSDSDSVHVGSDHTSQTEIGQSDAQIGDTAKVESEAKQNMPGTYQALDISYELPSDSECTIENANNNSRVGVQYRSSSSTIKGQSMADIDNLIAMYSKCGGKLKVLKSTVESKSDEEQTDDDLVQLRLNEIKYYLMQRRVPKTDMIFTDN